MIQLTTRKGVILVNPLNINYASRSSEGGTKIIFSNGEHLLVNQDFYLFLQLQREWERENG